MLKVYLKELLELTRDKKTMIFTILLPTLLIPVIMFGFISLIISLNQKASNEVLEYSIIGGENYPQIQQALESNDSFKAVTLASDTDFDRAINEERIRFKINIPEDTQDRLAKGLSAHIEVLYNDSSANSMIVISRINETLAEIKHSESNRRLEHFGISEAEREGLIDPIKMVEKSTADERESLGEKLGGMLPYILILLGLAGAMYPAIDLGVGEKERGTLETLLLTPVPRFHIVFAKFLVIFTTSFLSILLSLISFAAIILFVGPLFLSSVAAEGGERISQLIATLSTISLFDVFLIFLMLVPVSAIFGSLLLSVSIYARTFKEAQNYMSPIAMFAFLPVLLALAPGVKLDWVWASVPLTNVALAIKEIFKGTIDYGMLAVILASTTLVAGALLYLCQWWFQREQVLFRN
jgi:sodium transport system permease protein